MIQKNHLSPLVSIIITTYNRSQLVKQAIESARSQTYNNTEIIVVNDCSTDCTKNIINSYGDQIIQVHNNINRGLSHCRMIGYDHSQGEFIAYLDDDDTWVPEKIEKQVCRALAKPEAAVVTCGCTIHYRDTKSDRIRIPELEGKIRQEILKHGINTIPSCQLYRTKLFARFPGYDPKLRAHVDDDIWLSMMEADYSTTAVREPLVNIIEDGRSKHMSKAQIRIRGYLDFDTKWKNRVKQFLGKKTGTRFWKTYYGNSLLNSAIIFSENGNKRVALQFAKLALPHITFSNIKKFASFTFYLIMPDPIIHSYLKLRYKLSSK